MTFESFFVTDRDLIIVDVDIAGPRQALTGRFILDTGAAITTATPEFVEQLGYSARHGDRRTSVRTALGKEDGYLLHVAEFSALGVTLPNFEVNVFDLGHGEFDGLLGMNFLHRFNYEVRSAERRIFVQQIAA
jgi:predicted aspartyl protease